jgi:hypothetical protein
MNIIKSIRPINLGDKVKVLRNISATYKKYPVVVYSVWKYIQDEGYRVAAHVTDIALEDVEFRVSHAGIARMKRDSFASGKPEKSVIAALYGRIAQLPLDEETETELASVYYNPVILAEGKVTGRREKLTHYNEDGTPVGVVSYEFYVDGLECFVSRVKVGNETTEAPLVYAKKATLYKSSYPKILVKNYR